MRRIHYLTPPLDGVTIWRDHGERYYFDPKKRQLEIFDKSQHHHSGSTGDEALVLFEWLSRWQDSQQFSIAHPSEERVLWDLTAQLESHLVELLQPDYTTKLNDARTSVMEPRNAPGGR